MSDKDSIVEVMGDEASSIGDNGNIILSEGVLFDLGSSSIKNDSQAVLDNLIEVFGKFLSDGENLKYVDSIVISGHTDITGTAWENRVLSTDRANSVLNYLLTGGNRAAPTPPTSALRAMPTARYRNDTADVSRERRIGYP